MLIIKQGPADGVTGSPVEAAFTMEGVGLTAGS